MSIKTMLVYLPSEKNAAALLDPALKIATAHGAHVIGFYLIPDFPVYREFPSEVSDQVIEHLVRVGNDAAEAVKAVFDSQVKSAGVSSEWRCVIASYGVGADLIAQLGHTVDLAVCGKATEDAPDAWPNFAETVIMRSGRPVLMIPVDGQAPPRIGRRVMIAWNDTREAARAVFDSLPFIRKAETVCAITFIEKESHRAGAEALGEQLTVALGRHGIGATFDVSCANGGVRGEAILAKLQEDGCDLLVMGCYSHSWFREMVFGGVSRDILRDCRVPMLVSH